jgi:hypothetical protein
VVTHSRKPVRDHTQPNLVKKTLVHEETCTKDQYTQKRLTTQDGAKDINIASWWSLESATMP